MRNRTPNSSTPLDSQENWFYSVTEKGRRACAATSMQEAATSLRQLVDQLEKAAEQLMKEAPAPNNGANEGKALVTRRGTVCGRYRQHSNKRVPDLRLSGLWLGGAGFKLGQKYQVRVDQGRLTICAE